MSEDTAWKNASVGFDWIRDFTEEERDLNARRVAEELAQDRADAEGIEFTAAFEIEYCAAYEMHPVTVMKWQVAA